MGRLQWRVCMCCLALNRRQTTVFIPTATSWLSQQNNGTGKAARVWIPAEVNFLSNTWQFNHPLTSTLLVHSHRSYSAWIDEIIPHWASSILIATFTALWHSHSFVRAVALASIALNLQANSPGQSTGSAPPPRSPHPSPQRLMKKTSAGDEKVACPDHCDLLMSLFPFWQVLMRQGWLVSQPGGDDRHSLTHSLRQHRSILLPPSLPAPQPHFLYLAPFPLSYNKSTNTFYCAKRFKCLQDIKTTIINIS